MRTIRQPGAATSPRAEALDCRAERLRLTIRPQGDVLAAVAAALREHGCDSAIVEIHGGRFGRLSYLTPILSTDGVHAAWYSQTHAPAGSAQIEDLVLVVGRRDGELFIHGHGVWRQADGFRGAGHLLAADAAFDGEIEADVLGLSGAVMDQSDDAETRFRLFTPRPHAGRRAAREHRAVLCRLKPNEPLHRAIETIAREHGIERATLHGIGSLIGCTFASGEAMTAEASELLIRKGRLAPDASGQVRATLDLAIVDPDRRIFEGEIVHGADPVCITFELLIVEEGG